jgi:hypothetical protein
MRQRREEMAREVKQNRLAREPRRSRRRPTGVSDRALDFTWDLMRIAGRLLKFVKLLRDVDWGRNSDIEKCFPVWHREDEKRKKRTVHAPRPERGTEPPAVVSVVLDEDEDVEWIWTHTAEGKSLITKRTDKPR